MNRRRRIPVLLLLAFLPGPSSASGPEGYRVYETTAAYVNGEVLFLSDVAREACFLRCGAMPGTEPAALSLPEARDRRIADMLVLQEQKKLALGQVDNAARIAYEKEAQARMAACDSPCKGDVGPAQTQEWVERQLLIREFIRQRIAVFVEVKDQDVEREYRHRVATGREPDLTEDQVREQLQEEKVAQEVRTWFGRATSKARIVLSPMEGK